MRSHFEQQMELLGRSLTQMGGLCREVIILAARAVSRENPDDAERIPALDQEIDEMERSINSFCLNLLMHRDPAPQDLRVVSAAMRMITDMERIGDQASDIAEIVPFLQGHIGSSCALLQEMGEAASRMVTAAVEAYVSRDADLAAEVLQMDDVVDQFFRDVRSELIRSMTEDTAACECALDLMMIAKYFERIGDHATNIAEQVIFSISEP